MMLLDLGKTPDINISGTFQDYYTLLNKGLQNLHQLLQDLGQRN